MQFQKIALLVAILSGLSACSTSTNVTTTDRAKQIEPTAVSAELSAAALFNKAQGASGISKIQLLYSARDAAISEQDWQTLEQVGLALEAKPSVDHIQNKLYIAFARKQLGKYESALILLKTLEGRLTTPQHQAWHQRHHILF